MKRWITGIILSAILILLLTFASPLVIKTIMVLVAAGGCWEFLSINGEKRFGHKMLGLVLTVYGVVGASWLKDPTFLFLFFYVTLVFSFIVQFAGDLPNDQKIKNTFIFLFGVVYMVVPWGLFAQVADGKHFRFWLFFAVACTGLGDTFAYITGRWIGKHKLAPTLSPAKTVEGLLGAFVGGLVAAVILKALFQTGPGWITAMVLGVLVALLGALGDLSESLIKRGLGVKDSGHIIPGHGGVLDRVDAVMFTGPFVYFISQCF